MTSRTRARRMVAIRKQRAEHLRRKRAAWARTRISNLDDALIDAMGKVAAKKQSRSAWWPPFGGFFA